MFLYYFSLRDLILLRCEVKIMSSSNPIKSQSLGYLYVFLGIFLFATIEITAKVIETFSKFQQHFIRIVLGLLIISIILYFRRGTIKPMQYLLDHWKLIICAGFVWLSVASPSFFFALNLTKASTAALLIASNPILVALGSMILLGEKKTFIKLVAVILGFVGAFIIISELQFSGFEIKELIGNFLAFLSVFGYAIYTLVSIHIIDKETEKDKDEISPSRKFDLSIVFNFWAFLFGALFFCPVFFIDLLLFNPIAYVSGGDLLLILYLGIMTTGIAYILYTFGINAVETSRGVLFFYTKPVMAMFLAWLILKEPLTIYFILGFCLIFVALVVSEWEKRRIAKRKNQVKKD